MRTLRPSSDLVPIVSAALLAMSCTVPADGVEDAAHLKQAEALYPWSLAQDSLLLSRGCDLAESPDLIDLSAGAVGVPDMNGGLYQGCASPSRVSESWLIVERIGQCGPQCLQQSGLGGLLLNLTRYPTAQMPRGVVRAYAFNADNGNYDPIDDPLALSQQWGETCHIRPSECVAGIHHTLAELAARTPVDWGTRPCGETFRSTFIAFLLHWLRVQRIEFTADNVVRRFLVDPSLVNWMNHAEMTVTSAFATCAPDRASACLSLDSLCISCTKNGAWPDYTESAHSSEDVWPMLGCNEAHGRLPLREAPGSFSTIVPVPDPFHCQNDCFVCSEDTEELAVGRPAQCEGTMSRCARVGWLRPARNGRVPSVCTREGWDSAQ